MFGVSLKGAIFVIFSHAGKQAWMLPATKVSGFLMHRGIRTGMAANNILDKLRRNVEVFYCHPLSHLERRAIKFNPTY